LFDHSSGHAKRRIGGLDVGAMNKGFGGDHLRGTLIEKKEGYLGPNHSLNNSRMIQVGQVQELVYPAKESITDGDGPFYLTAQKEASRLNNEVELPLKKVAHREFTKKELIDALMNTNHSRDDGRIILSKMLVRDLRKLASNLGIITTKLVTHQMKPGWAGKGKGLLQILWEHGWIDEYKISEYKKIVTDDAGFIVKEFSLAHMLETCTDFANEKTQLEFVCQSLGMEALITTKYHAEYAGEGIEYCWGAAKAVYQCYPLASKKEKEKFVELVLKCTSRELLTTDLIRKFSRQARSYMLTYKLLEIVGEGSEDQSDKKSNDITHKQIENMQKICCSHRAALDFDKGFVVTLLKSGKDFDLKQEVEIGPRKKKRGRKTQKQDK
jgi:hypothetical protein